MVTFQIYSKKPIKGNQSGTREAGQNEGEFGVEPGRTGPDASSAEPGPEQSRSERKEAGRSGSGMGAEQVQEGPNDASRAEAGLEQAQATYMR